MAAVTKKNYYFLHHNLYNFTSTLAMVSYGYFGDLMQRSERYRWLGPKRYDISGVRTFLGNYKNCSAMISRN